MSEPIKVGDLVLVAKASSCGCANHVGMIFRVHKFAEASGFCKWCGNTAIGHLLATSGDNQIRIQPWRLRRIPPLSELESTETKEETPA